MAPPEFTVDFSRRQVDPFVLRRDEMLAFFEGQARETWEGWPTYEPKELIDAGDAVVALIRTSARGSRAGSRSTRASGTCGRSATGSRSSSSTSARTERLPWKPPGCRSRPVMLLGERHWPIGGFLARRFQHRPSPCRRSPHVDRLGA